MRGMRSHEEIGKEAIKGGRDERREWKDKEGEEWDDGMRRDERDEDGVMKGWKDDGIRGMVEAWACTRTY